MNDTRSGAFAFRAWRRNTEQLKLFFFRSTATRAFVSQPSLERSWHSSDISRLRSIRLSFATFSLPSCYNSCRRDCDVGGKGRTPVGCHFVLFLWLPSTAEKFRRVYRNFTINFLSISFLLSSLCAGKRIARRTFEGESNRRLVAPSATLTC